MALTHVNVDIETLGVTPDSVVLSLALIPFTFEEKCTYDDLISRGFYIKFNPIEQIKVGRITDYDTIQWWNRQNDEAKLIIKPSVNDVSVTEGLILLNDFIKSSKYDYKESYSWSRGQDFDFPIIMHLYRQFKIKYPLNSWKHRDIRTYIDILSGSKNGYFEMNDIDHSKIIKHNALSDTAMDIIRMKKLYDSLI
ncbi:MAG: 3'-5' exoribonuclease [Flavobacterium sp.]|uniref:3'-5' exoribonuclease domain-containing protein n=1 Tax=Flavobacterium sp. TaxID=239 RepID=UPI00260A0086|nr:3'-5' exoribonuclease [Flavobacterium sp.]MDD5150844.1 3'-5' exoribonuclease [Flavobacterium sp.]